MKEGKEEHCGAGKQYVTLDQQQPHMSRGNYLSIL
jgi:hypothetical protein